MRVLRTLLVCMLSAALAAGGVTASAAPSTSHGGTQVKVGVTKDFTHVEFHGAQPRAARREGRDLVLRFGAIAAPDISLLRVTPPPFLKAAVLQPIKGGYDLRMTLADGADAKLGKDGGAVFVNFQPEPPMPVAAAK